MAKAKFTRIADRHSYIFVNDRDKAVNEKILNAFRKKENYNITELAEELKMCRNTVRWHLWYFFGCGYLSVLDKLSKKHKGRIIRIFKRTSKLYRFWGQQSKK